MNEIPSINGLWEYQISMIRRNEPLQIPNINNIITTIPVIAELQQNGEFVILNLPPIDSKPESVLLGTLTKTHINSLHNDYFWTLIFSNPDDNGISTLTISEVSPDNSIVEWKGHYTESGLSGISPFQFQTAGIVSLKRVSNE